MIPLLRFPLLVIYKIIENMGIFETFKLTLTSLRVHQIIKGCMRNVDYKFEVFININLQIKIFYNDERFVFEFHHWPIEEGHLENNAVRMRLTGPENNLLELYSLDPLKNLVGTHSLFFEVHGKPFLIGFGIRPQNLFFDQIRRMIARQGVVEQAGFWLTEENYTDEDAIAAITLLNCSKTMHIISDAEPRNVLQYFENDEIYFTGLLPTVERLLELNCPKVTIQSPIEWTAEMLQQYINSWIAGSPSKLEELKTISENTERINLSEVMKDIESEPMDSDENFTIEKGPYKFKRHDGKFARVFFKDFDITLELIK